MKDNHKIDELLVSSSHDHSRFIDYFVQILLQQKL